jgi:hypothetical protein
MPIDSCLFHYELGYAAGADGTWTRDFEFAPSSVLCTAHLSCYYNNPDSAADAGITQYRTRDPRTGIDRLHSIGTSPEPGQTPAFYDDNVYSVTFYLYVYDENAGDVPMFAMALFNIFFWGS